ncbi:unnamed protein product [Symbiodinium natans]|uniref:Uncharacterized protein n=1 Tax=Symbiodinium natans TaxID=878477 RepID=A0A812LGN7_9DINO|nr:unnamed protein product [Symbiodinium natans]
MPSFAEKEDQDQDRTLLLDGADVSSTASRSYRRYLPWWLGGFAAMVVVMVLAQTSGVVRRKVFSTTHGVGPSTLVADEAIPGLRALGEDSKPSVLPKLPKAKAETTPAPAKQPPQHLRARADVQAPKAPVTNASKTVCKTAEPGDECYKAVLWAKWIGLVEHPGWYQGLDRRTANRRAIQEWLASKGQGGCEKPCEGGYPLPPLDKGSPSLFCFSVARKGPEMDTMYMTQQIRSGIFGCDGFAVYSDSSVDIDGFKTRLIPSTYAGVSKDGYAANSQVFMKTWMALLTGTEWYKYDFIAKVDPDCVFFPSRLRGHVANYVNQNVFFLNCGKYIPVTMYGALEVYSKQALGAYLSQHASCEQKFPYDEWGEDKYMTNCLESLGSRAVVDFGNFLHDERCWGVDCGNKKAVAFHAFKQVDKWYNCWLLSQNDGY